MKRIIITVVLSIMTICSFAQSSFSELSKIEGVESVYISKFMLSMTGGKVMEMDIPLSPKKLDGIYIYNAGKENSKEKAHKTAMKIIKKGKYETLMEANEEDEQAHIYFKKGEKGKNEFVIMSAEPNEFNLIVIIGNITGEDLNGMVNK